MEKRELEALVRSIVERAVARLREAAPAKSDPQASEPTDPLRTRLDAWLGRKLASPPGTARFAPPPDRAHALAATPARLGVGRAGTRLRTATLLQFLREHAAARDAVAARVAPALLESQALIPLRSAATDRREFLLRPDLGRRLHPDSADQVRGRGQRGARVQIVVVDGLSAAALTANLATLLSGLRAELKQRELAEAPAFFVADGRLGVGDEIARLLDSELLVTILGERPGLRTAESLGAYVTYFRGRAITEAARSMISNIHPGGLPPAQAARQLAELVDRALAERRTGVAEST